MSHRLLTTRIVAVGGLAFGVETDDPALAARFDRLLAAFPAAVTADPVVVSVRAVAEPGGRGVRYASSVDGELIAETATAGEQEYHVLRVLNRRALDADAGHLHVHGGGVARDGRAVALVGRSGSGKSSLTAALVRGGWDYLTDERLAIRPDDARIEPFPRPLTLRPDMWTRFTDLVPSGADPGGDRTRVEVAPSDLGRVAPFVPHELGGVCFPDLTPDSATALESIGTAAECVEHLAASCHDLDRLGCEGLDVLARWAARAPAWRVRASEPTTAATLVEEAFAAVEASEPVVVDRWPGGNAGPPAAGTVVRAPDAEAWAFADGSAVVFRPGTRQLARTDLAGLDLWERLRRPVAVAEVVAAVGADDGVRDAVHAWLDRMRLTGFLISGDAGAER